MAPTDLVDIVVFGATSYCGGYVVEHLLKHPEKPTFAIAGRSQTKLSALRTKYDVPASVPTIVADSADEAAIKAMVSRGRLVLNLAGPYNRFNAIGVIDECVKQGRHYTDLTGESGFYKKVVDGFHEKAKAAGVVIVPTCGFDSTPFDVGAYLAVQQLKSQNPDAKVTDVTTSCSGFANISKGTLMSAVDMASAKGGTWQMQNTKADIFSPKDGNHKLPWGPSPMRAPGFHGYMSYFPLSPHNHRIVNRTWGLLETESTKQTEKYGDSFQFRDGVVFPGGWLGNFIATLYVKTFAVLLIWFAPIRWAIASLPDGFNTETPYTKSIARLDSRTVAESEGGEKAILHFRVNGDAAYEKTAVMIAEGSLTILNDFKRMHPIAQRGGVITTALLGPGYPERLVKEGSFAIESEPFDSDLKKKKN